MKTALSLFCLLNLLAHTALAELCIKGITVAVIDTGADISHPMFKSELWVNPGESGLDKNGKSKTTNQVDDDNNGYVDDVHGWNFVNDNPNLQDYSGHGTHISGLIKLGAEGAPLKLMVLKYYDPRYDERAAQTEFLSAMKYAIEMGADVINISGGGYRPHSDEWELVKLAQSKKIAIVAASGNTLQPTQEPTRRPFFPAAYALSNVVSVVATNRAGEILPSSNIPPAKANMFMPGDDIESALPDGRKGVMTGSSQAAASYTGRLLARYATECQKGESVSKRKNN